MKVFLKWTDKNTLSFNFLFVSKPLAKYFSLQQNKLRLQFFFTQNFEKYFEKKRTRMINDRLIFHTNIVHVSYLCFRYVKYRLLPTYFVIYKNPLKPKNHMTRSSERIWFEKSIKIWIHYKPAPILKRAKRIHYCLVSKYIWSIQTKMTDSFPAIWYFRLIFNVYLLTK